MTKRHLCIQSVTFDCINFEIVVWFTNDESVRIVRQFYTHELVGGTDEMREMALPIAEKYNDFLQGAKL